MGLLLAALAGGLLFFNSQATPERVESAIATSLRQRMPEAQVNVDVEGRRGIDVVKGRFRSVRVQVTGARPGQGELLRISAVPKAKKSGRIGQVALQMRDFELNGLQIESADIAWNDVVYDFNALKNNQKLALVSVGSGTADIVIPQTSLQTLLETKSTGIEAPKIVLRDGRMELSGTREVPLFGKQSFSLNARLEPRNGNEIWLTDAQGSVAGTPVPAPLLNQLLKGFNPVYAFTLGEQWPFTAQLTSVNVSEGKLELVANLTFVPAAKAPAASTAPQAAPRATTPAPVTTPVAAPTPA